MYRISLEVKILMLIILGSLVISAFLSYDERLREKNLQTLTFSNTQEWDPEILELKESANHKFSVVLNRPIPPPPLNTDLQTKDEIRALHSLAAERTTEKLAEIHAEIDLDTTRFGSQTLEEIFSNRPLTTILIDESLESFTPIIIELKEYFDRVRPSYLDPTLPTTIAVPGHPAYPSGHAAQSRLIARILGELDAENASSYEESAKRIARNREIAGVHYKSDSNAGNLLADKYFDELLKVQAFREQLEAARWEW